MAVVLVVGDAGSTRGIQKDNTDRAPRRTFNTRVLDTACTPQTGARHSNEDATMPQTSAAATHRYAKAIENSRRVHWEIEDLIRGRRFDFTRKFLPDGLSLVKEMPLADEIDERLMSHVQGRSYANIFGLVERFISAKMSDVTREHWFGDQTAFEALVRFTDDELKHQALFRRIEQSLGAEMGPGYVFVPQPNEVAAAVLGKSTWAVMGLTSHIELFVSAHYRCSIDPDPQLDPLWKDVFLYHWKDEAQHVILDELEWTREDARLTPAQRDVAVDDLIALVGAVDGILQLQAGADADYFFALTPAIYADVERERIHEGVLKAYRWQYIVSGVMEPRFQKTLFGMVSDAQRARIEAALAPLLYAVPVQPEMALPMAA
jgi:hypothetical protein